MQGHLKTSKSLGYIKSDTPQVRYIKSDTPRLKTPIICDTHIYDPYQLWYLGIPNHLKTKPSPLNQNPKVPI